MWRRMEKINWTDRVINEVLHRVKEEMNILHTIKRRKANWIGHILRRNCLLKHVTEGKIEGQKWREEEEGGVRSYLVTLRKRYWKLKDGALDRTLWRTRFERGYGPVVRQTTEWMNQLWGYFILFNTNFTDLRYINHVLITGQRITRKMIPRILTAVRKNNS